MSNDANANADHFRFITTGDSSFDVPAAGQRDQIHDFDAGTTGYHVAESIGKRLDERVRGLDQQRAAHPRPIEPVPRDHRPWKHFLRLREQQES